MTYNQALTRARSLRGWSQATVAEKLGTSRKNVSRWECGETLPSPYFRERLCQLFECDTEALNLLSPSASGYNRDTNVDMTKSLPLPWHRKSCVLSNRFLLLPAASRDPPLRPCPFVA